jgi:hypothetical protein
MADISKILKMQNCYETWWSYRYMFLVGPKVFSFVVKGASHILRGSKGVGVTIESYGKV